MVLTQNLGSFGSVISYGTNTEDESQLKLCGSLIGKRVLELGLPGDRPNSIAIARAGARTIAIDPSTQRIAELRETAKRSNVNIECHELDLADLGVISSGYLDLVLCVQQMHMVSDLSRLLRQVHRVLKPNGMLVMSLPHPVAQMFDGDSNVAVRPYGSHGSRNLGDLFMSLRRTNFSIDVVHELQSRTHNNRVAPSTLVMRAQKLGL